MSQRSLEMKVGGLILASLVLMLAFIMVMGGVSLKPEYRIYVEFDNPGGLQTGSPVRIAGARIGRVNSIELVGRKLDAQGQPVPPILVVASIDLRYQKSIHRDASFFISSQGLLGEMHLAIDPGSPNGPVLADGSHVRGISPPRFDQLLGEGYELLHRAFLGVSHREKQLGETFDGLHKTLHGTGQLVEKNQATVQRMLERLDRMSEEAEDTLLKAREQYVDGERIERILSRLDHITKVVDENLEPFMKDGRGLVADGHAMSQVLASPEQLENLKSLTTDTKALLKTAQATAGDAQVIVAQVRAGRGTAGALLMDEALYDDLQELIRDLKQNPWKILWKE